MRAFNSSSSALHMTLILGLQLLVSSFSSRTYLEALGLFLSFVGVVFLFGEEIDSVSRQISQIVCMYSLSTAQLG